MRHFGGGSGNLYKSRKGGIGFRLAGGVFQYIDMLLLHHPGTNDVKAYKAMEQAVREGKIVISLPRLEIYPDQTKDVFSLINKFIRRYGEKNHLARIVMR